jgi:2-oxoglutarate dehydrogenase E1 component
MPHMSHDLVNVDNLAQAEATYEAYLRDPNAVDQAWRTYFANLDANGAGTWAPPPDYSQETLFRPAATAQASDQQVRDSNTKQEHVDQLIRAYRSRGHRIANLDPLGRRPTEHPELALSFHGLSDADLDTRFSAHTLGGGPLPLRDIISKMRNTYCRTIGVQFMHIENAQVRNWLLTRMESTENHARLSRDEQVQILTKLTDAENFETFVHKKFIGAKRFSLEGAESLIPLLDTAIEQAAVHGVEQMVIGMAHRGRLNVLANIIGKSPQKIFTEFTDADPFAKPGRGDVKYHLGYSSDRKTNAGTNMHLSLCFNPSHLEFVGPVAVGRVRAKQDRLNDGARSKVLGVVIHGDAAFPGQGVNLEALNMGQLPGYSSGGTLHIVVNNQVGFTTPPELGRSTPYATDLARMLEVPIFHVNGEDPESVTQVVRLALEFQATYKRDVFIDMYCYRRLGHNESDEPAFTQPVMYQWISQQPTVRQGYLNNLLKLGGVSREEAEQIDVRCRTRLEEDLARVKRGEKLESREDRGIWKAYIGNDADAQPQTGPSKDGLAQLLRVQTELPAEFTANSKIVRLLEGRREMAEGKRSLDWGGAEALAFASLAAEGTRIRLSGQDSGRGTFSHRHAILYDANSGNKYIPLMHVADKQGAVEIWDSPLSETAVLGFDYGYSLDSPDGLVMWEAQFGDFANGAQVIIDQFIASGESKWQRMSGVVLLLPHGYEGQGGEHSSARLERFLCLAAENNIQVAYPTTPAQIFHLLRRQVVRPTRKPLVVMSPKSLLRHPQAVSSLEEMADGHFQEVIPEVNAKLRTKARRVLICSGKVYYDLLAARQERKADDVAIVRVEQLYPNMPKNLEPVLGAYAKGTQMVWLQEEPANMGAWPYICLKLGGGEMTQWNLRCVAREESASPASGSMNRHKHEHNKLMDQAFA